MVNCGSPGSQNRGPMVEHRGHDPVGTVRRRDQVNPVEPRPPGVGQEGASCTAPGAERGPRTRAGRRWSTRNGCRPHLPQIEVDQLGDECCSCGTPPSPVEMEKHVIIGYANCSVAVAAGMSSRSTSGNMPRGSRALCPLTRQGVAADGYRATLCGLTSPAMRRATVERDPSKVSPANYQPVTAPHAGVAEGRTLSSRRPRLSRSSCRW